MSQAESNGENMGLGLPGMVPVSLLEPKDLEQVGGLKDRRSRNAGAFGLIQSGAVDPVFLQLEYEGDVKMSWQRVGQSSIQVLRTKTSSMNASVNGMEKGFKVLVQAVTYPLIPKERG